MNRIVLVPTLCETSNMMLRFPRFGNPEHPQREKEQSWARYHIVHMADQQIKLDDRISDLVRMHIGAT